MHRKEKKEEKRERGELGETSLHPTFKKSFSGAFYFRFIPNQPLHHASRQEAMIDNPVPVLVPCRPLVRDLIMVQCP